VATLGAKGQTIEEYCTDIMGKCEYNAATTAALAASGKSLVKYCQAQKKLLETKCEDVHLTAPEATYMTLWEKCKKELMPKVGIARAEISQGQIIPSGGQISIGPPEGPTGFIKFFVAIKTESHDGISGLDCKVDEHTLGMCSGLKGVHNGVFALPPILAADGDLSTPINLPNDYVIQHESELKSLGYGKHILEIIVVDSFDKSSPYIFTWNGINCGFCNDVQRNPVHKD